MLQRCSNPVVAVTIPNDVYLTYSIFILTSAMRITSFPLNLRSESPSSQLKIAPAPYKKTDEKSPWLTPAEGPTTYVSLLRDEPYVPAPVLTHSSGLPSNPKLFLPPSINKDAEFVLTPDTLRYIGTTVKEFTDQIHDIHLAVRAAEARVLLQRSELTRIVGKCREMESLVERLKGPTKAACEARFEKVQNEQKVLLARMDRMLQGLMEQASPELSEHETKWFEELKRMKAEITGSGKYDEGSLAARTRLVCLPLILVSNSPVYVVRAAGKRICTVEARPKRILRTRKEKKG